MHIAHVGCTVGICCTCRELKHILPALTLDSIHAEEVHVCFSKHIEFSQFPRMLEITLLQKSSMHFLIVSNVTEKNTIKEFKIKALGKSRQRLNRSSDFVGNWLKKTREKMWWSAGGKYNQHISSIASCGFWFNFPFLTFLF